MRESALACPSGFLSLSRKRAYSGVAPRTAAVVKTFPSKSVNRPNSARQIRVAFSSMVAKTGWRSPGERLMTLSTSAVAVCRSSASRVSLMSRAFSIAITA